MTSLKSEHGAYFAVEASFSISKEKHGDFFCGELPLFLPRHSSFGGFPMVFPMGFLCLGPRQQPSAQLRCRRIHPVASKVPIYIYIFKVYLYRYFTRYT